MANWEKLIEEYYNKKKEVEASLIMEMIDLELENTFQFLPKNRGSSCATLIIFLVSKRWDKTISPLSKEWRISLEMYTQKFFIDG